MDVTAWYRELPVITRSYVTLCVLTTAAVALDLVTPFDLYFNSRLIVLRRQWWRVPASFFFFGNAGLDFVFHMFFLTKYSKSLEEGSFRNRPADFLWMLLFGAGVLALCAPFVSLQFLGSSLAFMLVYVWGRRHAEARLSFLGFFDFSAPYLPWVLLALSILLGNSPLVDLLGMFAGHSYFFLEDVYPISTGRRVLRTPGLVRRLFRQVDRGQPPVHPPPVAAAAAGAAAAVGQRGALDRAAVPPAAADGPIVVGPGVLVPEQADGG